MGKRIEFCSHAEDKFEILRRHGIHLTRAQIEETVSRPQRTYVGSKGRTVAQGPFDEDHLIRVIYEDKDDIIRAITFYIARRERYEGQL